MAEHGAQMSESTITRYVKRRGGSFSAAGPCSAIPTAGVITVHINPISRSRVRRMAWSLVRHPMKSRDFPAKHERLVTADELLHLEV